MRHDDLIYAVTPLFEFDLEGVSPELLARHVRAKKRIFALRRFKFRGDASHFADWVDHVEEIVHMAQRMRATHGKPTRFGQEGKEADDGC